MLCKCIHVIISDPDFHLQKKSKVLNPRQALMTDTNFKNEKKGKTDWISFVTWTTASHKYDEDFKMVHSSPFVAFSVKSMRLKLCFDTLKLRQLKVDFYTLGDFHSNSVLRYLQLWICNEKKDCMKPIFEPKSDDKLFCSLFWNEETYVKVGLWCTKLFLFDLMKAFFLLQYIHIPSLFQTLKKTWLEKKIEL